MLKGVHLSLLMGPMQASPVPGYVIDALVSVSVNAGGSRSGFQVQLAWSKNSPIDRDLQSGAFDPLIRVIMAVTINGATSVIMDGLITRQEIAPSDDPGRSTLTLTGEDLSAAMDLINLTGLIPYPAMPPEVRVLLIIAKYTALFGVLPMVIPSPLIDIELPIEKWKTHLGTDLQYLRSLAQRRGYVFYVEPGPAIGVSYAYWGPEIRYGEVQPALSLGFDAHTNCDSLSFSFDGTQRTIPVVMIQIKQTGTPIPIPIPDLGILRPPLAAREALPLKFETIDTKLGTAKEHPVAAALIGLARASQSSDAVTGSGQLDVVRYGNVLKARQLVGVRGAGQAYDGVYYVKTVTHSIKRGEYKQSFTLAREGIMPLDTRVPL
jgi:hypothetical protein